MVCNAVLLIKENGDFILIHYILAWIPMLFIATGNGILRQSVFAKKMSELRAHQLSTATGSVLIGLFI